MGATTNDVIMFYDASGRVIADDEENTLAALLGVDPELLRRRACTTREESKDVRINTELLKEKLRGRKLGWLADELGITRPTLNDKIEGRTEFLPSQIRMLIEILGLTPEEVHDIFLI